MKYIAFLRGINVGGNNKVDMKQLKACFETLGYQNIFTYINSGNIIFETPSKDSEKIVKEIEKAITHDFGFDIRVVVRDDKNIEKICKLIPAEWTNDAKLRTDVLFLWDDYDSKKSISLIKAVEKIDTLLYVPGAIVWHVKKEHYTKSGLNKFIGTVLYKDMTARNINTVRKIAANYL